MFIWPLEGAEELLEAQLTTIDYTHTDVLKFYGSIYIYIYIYIGV